MQSYIEVELGGKTRTLKYDYNSICDLEEKFGMGIGAIMSEVQVGYRALRTIYWAGLRWNDRGLTVERVGQMLSKEIQSGTSLEDLMRPPFKAMERSGVLGKKSDEQEEEEGEDDAEGKPVTKRTGKGSKQ